MENWSGEPIPVFNDDGANTVPVLLHVNGKEWRIDADPRATLLDTLRERLRLTGTKKGCDRGECGACTVHVGGRRILSCMTLAVMHDGDSIATIEGIGGEGGLHPVQRAFIDHDGFQCGYCTPGQIMSAIALLEEVRDGLPSALSAEGDTTTASLGDDEIRERMSGNICRCSCYPGIVAAIGSVARAGTL